MPCLSLPRPHPLVLLGGPWRRPAFHRLVSDSGFLLVEESRLEKDGFLLDFRLPPMKWPGAHTSSTLIGSQSHTMSTAPGGEAPRREVLTSTSTWGGQQATGHRGDGDKCLSGPPDMKTFAREQTGQLSAKTRVMGISGKEANKIDWGGGGGGHLGARPRGRRIPAGGKGIPVNFYYFFQTSYKMN